ncbi:MAG: hypothetical protein A2283_12425 [Lentisphaerae bacterium RIFOXYA12_FULL_48_11]|nr:MAG: hypothetical protein A2283_12425 [Lentisphaerae bacterium RIFOXYA12_FULL_48_11]
MKGLLLAIKNELSGLFTGLRDSDIYLLPDANILPDGARLPCIGIKDGKTGISELPCDTLLNTLPVEVYCFDKLVSGDDCILDFLDKGKLIFDKLRGNDLTGYVREVSPISATPIDLMYTKTGLILRKGYFFEYEKLEE